MADNVTDKWSLDDLDRISDTFKGKKVLITGGTGFIGKVLVEKLLRVCPNIGGIILLIRQKKGKNPKQRVEDMFNNPLFTPLLSLRDVNQLLTLVTVVNGDVAEVDLGLSQRDRAICQTAHIIVHSAANVRFDEGIKSAVLLNTRGTKYMLELAKQCPQLELFVHVSTAYCHPEEKVMEERLYPPPAEPNEMIKIVEKLDERTIDVMTAKLLGDFPNTYAYSKALAESLVEQAMMTMPVIIIRPSVVIPIYNDPVKGWTDNINGPIGLLIGAGKGVIRTMYGNSQSFADFIPADCVVNALMVVTWDYLKNGYPHKVVNLTTSEEIRLSWKEVLDLGRHVIETRVPFDNVLWYPGGEITSHRWLHKIRVILYHWIPAIIIDMVLFCLGYKPLLMRIQTRISKSFDLFEFYTNNQWQFRSDNIRAMRVKLNNLEKNIYKLDSEGLDMTKYFENGIIAARRYILKEPDENLPRAKRHMKVLWYLNIVVKIIFYVYLLYWMSAKISTILI